MQPTVLAILAVVVSAYGSEDEYFPPILTYKRQELQVEVVNFLKRAARSLCEDNAYDLKSALSEFLNRIEEVDLESETLCDLVANHFQHVAEPLVNAVEDCAPPENVGMATFLTRTVVNVVDYLCHIDGKHMIELNNPCIDKLYVKDNKCFGTHEEIRAKAAKLITSGKSDFCRDAVELKNCLVSDIAEHCRLKPTQDATVGLLESILEDCDPLTSVK